MFMINPDSFLQNCFAAALFSTCAAVGIKHAFSSSLISGLLHKYLCGSISQFGIVDYDVCNGLVSKLLPILQFLCMMPVNTKALQHSLRAMHIASTSRAVVTNLAFSFILGGLLGYIVFDEPVNVQWWFGIGIVLLGVYLLSINKTETTLPSPKKNE